MIPYGASPKARRRGRHVDVVRVRARREGHRAIVAGLDDYDDIRAGGLEIDTWCECEDYLGYYDAWGSYYMPGQSLESMFEGDDSGEGVLVAGEDIRAGDALVIGLDGLLYRAHSNQVAVA